MFQDDFSDRLRENNQKSMVEKCTGRCGDLNIKKPLLICLQGKKEINKKHVFMIYRIYSLVCLLFMFVLLRITI